MDITLPLTRSWPESAMIEWTNSVCRLHAGCIHVHLPQIPGRRSGCRVRDSGYQGVVSLLPILSCLSSPRTIPESLARATSLQDWLPVTQVSSCRHAEILSCIHFPIRDSKDRLVFQEFLSFVRRFVFGKVEVTCCFGVASES